MVAVAVDPDDVGEPLFRNGDHGLEIRSRRGGDDLYMELSDEESRR